MWKRNTSLAPLVLAFAALLALPANAAPVPIAASLQWRGHLPELGARPSVRLFQTAAQYESFRSSLSDANLFPQASQLFMSFERHILVLYVRGEDSGGRCLRLGSTATVDGDTVTLDLVWEGGTCGAPSTARHPFVMLSLSRTAPDGTPWATPTRSVCGAPSGVDRVCATVSGGAAASPSPTPAAPAPATATATPRPSPTPSRAPTTPSPSPSTPAPTIAALATPTLTRSPEPPPREVDVPTDDTVNYLLWGALGLIVVFVTVAGLFARSPRR